jgi:23S rRNA pseudouridine1911/1915/1917 synthase
MEIPRQMLHAESLTISHPVSKEAVTFRAPPPEDFEQILAALKSRS